MNRFRICLIMPLLLLSACQSDQVDGDADDSYTTGVHAAPTSAAELIGAMHARYAEDWYDTVTFEQQTIEYRAAGSDTSSWFEAMRIPGQLRIDIGAPASGDAYLFRSDSLYVFSAGKISVARETLHPLLLLGFDVYKMQPSDLLIRLDSLGFDLDRFSENSWQDRPVYVVGALTGDEMSPQFWIDQERLVFVRMLQPAGQDGASVQEVQFNGYVPLGGGWISTEVDFFFAQTLTMTERYSQIEFNTDLDPALFVPESAMSATHWVKPDPSN